MANPTPILTLLLESIKDCIETVTDYNSVSIDPERGLSGLYETEKQPFAWIVRQNETSRKVNDYREATFQLFITNFVKANTYKEAREQAIYLMGLTQQALLVRGSLARQYCQYFEEADGNAFDVFYFEDCQVACINEYLVKYRYAYGNPFQQNVHS